MGFVEDESPGTGHKSNLLLEGPRRRHDGESGHQRNKTEPLEQHGLRRGGANLLA